VYLNTCRCQLKNLPCSNICFTGSTKMSSNSENNPPIDASKIFKQMQIKGY
jgi:hypothetical protein